MRGWDGFFMKVQKYWFAVIFLFEKALMKKQHHDVNTKDILVKVKLGDAAC